MGPCNSLLMGLGQDQQQHPTVHTGGVSRPGECLEFVKKFTQARFFETKCYPKGQQKNSINDGKKNNNNFLWVY